jgi:hypothetical protein
MKMQKRMTMVVLAGLAAVALVAGPVRARGIQAGAVQSEPAVQQSLAANGDYAGDAVPADDAAVVPFTAQEVELGRAIVLNVVGLAILMAGAGLIVVYTIFATRRRDLQPVLRGRVAGMNAYGASAASGAISR